MIPRRLMVISIIDREQTKEWSTATEITTQFAYVVSFHVWHCIIMSLCSHVLCFVLVKISTIVSLADYAFLIGGSTLYKTTYSCIQLFQCVIMIHNTRLEKLICIFRGIAKHISLSIKKTYAT